MRVLRDREQRSRLLTMILGGELLLAVGTIIFAALTQPETPDILARESFIFASEIGAIFVFAFFTLLSLALALAAVLSRGQGVRVDSLIYLALCVMLTGIWLLFASGFPRWFIHNQVVRQLIIYFTFYLLPIPFLFFVRNVCRSGRWLLDVFAALFLLSFAVNYVWLLALGLVFPPTLPLVHGLIILAVAVCIGVSLRERTHYRDRNANELVFGIIGLAVTALVDLLIYYLNFNNGQILFIVGGMILLITSTSIGAVRQLVQRMNRARSVEIALAETSAGISRERLDVHLTLVYANEEFYRMFGFGDGWEQELTSYAQITTVAERTRVRRQVDEHLSAGRYTFELEMKTKCRDGEVKWIMFQGRYNPADELITSAVADITQRKLVEDQLRISEEELRIAAGQSDKSIVRYEVATCTLYQHLHTTALFGSSARVENIPEAQIAEGAVAPESIEKYRSFFAAMRRGEPRGSVVARLRMAGQEEFRWYHADFTLIYAVDGGPKHGVISFYDVTELRQKELAYEKWRQELAAMPQERTALFEWNLTRDVSEGEGGEMIEYFQDLPHATFDSRTIAYAENRVYFPDRLAYLSLLNRERLIGAFYEGAVSHEMDYRELRADGEFKWMHLSVQLVQYPDSGEIKAYLIISDIDAEMRERLSIASRAREDGLTGVLNRVAFIEEVAALLRQTPPGVQHAFVMIDLDQFKQINDTLGHAEGDRVLRTIAAKIKALLREDDLISRVGGDEFMLCLKNISNQNAIALRLEQLSQLIYEPLAGGMAASGSIGVSIYSRDGGSFEELYRKADAAMYRAKTQGRGRYQFYHQDMATDEGLPRHTPIDAEDGIAL